MPKVMFEKFIAWNRLPYKFDVTYDRRFVHVLLYALVEEEKLSKNDVATDVIDFIKGKTKICIFILTVHIFI